MSRSAVASHPLLSGLAGFVLVPLTVGFLTRFVVKKDDSPHATAIKTGFMHASGAVGSWLAMERLSGDAASMAKGALVGEALDAVFAPATIVAADAVRKMAAGLSAVSFQPSAVSQTPVPAGANAPASPQTLPMPPPQDAIDPTTLGVRARFSRSHESAITAPGMPRVGEPVLIDYDEDVAPGSTYTSLSGSFWAPVLWASPDAPDGGYVVVATSDDIVNASLPASYATAMKPGQKFYAKASGRVTAPATISGRMTAGLMSCAKTAGRLPPLSTIEQTIAQLKAAF